MQDQDNPMDAAVSAFVAGAMWAARELGQPETEATAWVERARAAAREGYGLDDRQEGEE